MFVWVLVSRPNVPVMLNESKHFRVRTRPRLITEFICLQMIVETTVLGPIYKISYDNLMII